MQYRNASDDETLPALMGSPTTMVNTLKQRANIVSLLNDPVTTTPLGCIKVSQRMGRSIWLSAIRTSQDKAQRRPLKSGQDRLVKRELRRKKRSLRKLNRLTACILKNDY